MRREDEKMGDGGKAERRNNVIHIQRRSPQFNRTSEIVDTEYRRIMRLTTSTPYIKISCSTAGNATRPGD